MSRPTLVLIRHAPTAWNAEGRVQGQTDIDLSPEGRKALAGWLMPPDFRDLAAFSSPLRRAVDTAAGLGLQGAARDHRLMEMDWGAWEGERIAELRARLGAAMAANEARGFDFRPPGGESPRMLLARLGGWLAEVAAAERSCVAVTHAGVIRVLYAAATGWDLTGPRPVKFQRAAAQVFTLGPDGTPALEALNVPLEPSCPPRAS